MTKRFLNVEYSVYKTRINVTDMEDLSEVLSAIKEALSIEVGYGLIQLYTNSNKDQLITDLDDISPEKTPQYYQKLTQGGSCVVIGTSPPSRQATQIQLFTHIQSPSAISTFWNAFKACTTPIEENQVIQLPTNVYILGNPTLGSSVFIRHCYPKLLKTALSIIETPRTPHLVILGNPGIGKTYFGYVLLLYLARHGSTVVYESGKAKSRYLFSADGIFIGTQDDFRRYLDITTTLYIVDASKPVDVAAKTILLSSPRRDVWYKFSDDYCTIRYMPVWSQEEIEICHKLVFNHLSQDLVKFLYDKWGGIPRNVLENAEDVAQQLKLDDAISAVDLNLLTKAIGNSEASDSAAHRLIHLHVGEDFRTDRHYLFASDYVADRVYLHFYTTKRNELTQFLAVSQGVGDIGVLRGILFERHAHTVISKGGSFKIRDLQTAQERTLELPSDLTIFLYSSNDSIFQNATNGYFRPVSKIFESVDSFIKPNLLFQMTGAKDHPCKQTGLRDVLKILGNPLKPELYFVVPPDRFASFKYQSYHGTDGKVLSKKGIVANVRKLSQFVLTFELSSQ